MQRAPFIFAVMLLSSAAAFAQAPPTANAGDDDIASENTETAAIEEQNLKLSDRIPAVSNVLFSKAGRFELSPYVGASMSDAFFRRWTVGARAGFSFTESFALEVGGAVNAFSQPLAPVVLLEQADVVFEDEDKVIGYGDASVVYSPFYGKLAAMSEWIIHFDAFGIGGLGATFDGTDAPVDPSLILGGGARVVLNNFLALRVDVRDYLTVQDAAVNNFIVLNAGISIFFPFDSTPERGEEG